MRDAAERRRLSADPQGQRTPEGDYQQCEDIAHHQGERGYTVSSGSAVLSGASLLQAPQWVFRRNMTPPQQPIVTENRGGVPVSLLLSRSIRDQAHPRATGSLFPEVRRCRAHSADNRNESQEMEVPQSLGRHVTALPSSHPSAGSPGTPSSSPTTTSTGELEIPMAFESLWSNIDRYLFAVYTTLQTGDESSLRPLRTPKHRMGWYTVIYNACSGDPTKSRELYARLALLLLHILESHVLFPILQNVDHSHVQFLTGTEDDAGTRRSGSPRQGQGSRNAPTGSATTGGSGSGWSRFKSIATAVKSGSVHGIPSSEMSRNSSFVGPASGHGNNNGSFAFVKRLLHPLSSPVVAASAARASPVIGAGSHAKEGEGGAGRPSQSPKAPAPPVTATGNSVASSSVSGRGTNWFRRQGSSTRWSAARTSGPSSPPQHFVSHTSGMGDASTSPSRPRSSGDLAVPESSAAANELQTAFFGFDCTVRHSAEERVSLEPPNQQRQSAGFSAVASVQPSATASPPVSPTKAAHTPPTPSSATSRHSTQQKVSVPTELNRFKLMECTRTSIGGKALPTAMQSTAPHHHARVASKTGRVLVDDEEEMLCEVYTVSPAVRDSIRRLQRWGSGSDSSSVAALASFNDTEAGSAGSPTQADDDDSLRTMNSSIVSENLGHERPLRTGRYAGNGANAPAARVGARSRNAARAGAGPYTDDADEVGTMEPLPASGSPFTSTLNPGDRTPSPLISTQPSTTLRSTVINAPPSSPKTAARAVATSELRTSFPGTKTASDISMTAAGTGAHGAPLSSPDAAVALAAPEASATSDTASSSPPTPAFSAAAKTASAACGTGTVRPDERRFSLCYTFLQEWQTFLVFRSVVLSCFRYLDQYYTRRFGMDTITLMCFKVFYVVVYEPLQPLLVIELRHLMQYVREVFEATSRVAWEQLRLIQETYSVMTELLLLVQSTSSSMVAQQQQPQAGSGVSGGGTAATATVGGSNAIGASSKFAASSVTAGVSAPLAPPATAEVAAAETPVQSHASSRARSTASSAASTPRVGALDPHIVSSTVTAPSPGDGDEERSGARSHVSRRHRLISRLISGRLGDGFKGGSNSGRGQRATSTPVSPWASSASANTSAAGLPSAFERNSSASADGKVAPRAQAYGDGDNGGLPARGEVDCRGATHQGSAAVVDSISAPAVVVDLRGTVELHDRLERNTTTRILTTQALKQWEGMAAARRLHLGTIVKEIAKPLATIVMEDVGNEYIAGIYAFYRCTREAHRSTEEGRRSYVEWAGGVKELERHVWRRVQLAFLHASLRSALNEVLVVEPHRSILLDARFGLRALLDVWSSSVEAAGLSLAPQMSAAAARPGGAAARACGVRGATAAALHWRTDSATTSTSLGGGVDEADPLARSGEQPGGSKHLMSPISLGAHGSLSSHASSLPHQHAARTFLFAVGKKHEMRSQILASTAVGEEEDGGRRSGKGGGALSEAQWTTATRSHSPITVAAVASSISHSSGDCFTAHVGAWAGGGRGEGETSALGTATMPCVTSGSNSSSYLVPKNGATDAALAPHQELGDQLSLSSGTAAAVDSRGTVSGEGEGDVASALAALESLYRLFSDVTGDECFVLMAAIIITKLIRDAADIIEQYLRAVSGSVSAAPSSPHPQAAGIQLMAGLVELMERYTDLVEGAFHSHAIVHRALSDAIEELMRPIRWTRKGALQTSQQRAHEALMAAAAAAAKAETVGRSSHTPASDAGTDLPNVLLSRDARQATLPLVELAANYPQAVQQLRLSTLVARYVDVLLQQECGGGRVLSSKLHKRLRLIAQLVSLLEDKDMFLEHYRLCLARRLLGYASGTADPQLGSPSGSACGVVGGRAKQPLAVGHTFHGSSAATSLNMEAERQLVSFLQLYLGATGTHAFEAMLRDYEGTERTRELFEQEAVYKELPAKIRVQLITSAQWPTYAMPPLQTHISLQRGMDVFRAHYARQHPSRTLLWVFSLGSATLSVELVSGTKQVVASTILATLLLAVSDAYNAEGADAAQGGALTGAQLAHVLGLPFHSLRAHLHLLTHHRAFHLLRCIPANTGGAGATAATEVASITENDSFSLNPFYTHKLRKIRLPLPRARPTSLPPGDAQAFGGGLELASRPEPPATPSSPTSNTAAAPVTINTDEDAVVARHVHATRRVLLDAALVRVLKCRRVVLFEDLLQTVTAQLSRQFVPSRRDVKAQLEGLIDRDYVKRSPKDPNTFIYLA
ncbi:hypothetical protein LSCM4_05661 [Leishmania orientalis]|uniref:Cullin family profile domain-containing protein n=1 Tax=Leishmania orientalis TaxID=2249476 RepID=A0A836HJE2_9TRYP|nr:hypothetical protein LSCM4_05661 [Leishmania orientalis]